MAVLKMQPSTKPVSAVDAAIGRQVHELLWTRGIRQQPVYTALGISRSALTKKMRGEIRWYAEDLVIVAGLLGVPPGDLLPRLDSNQQPSGCRVIRGFAAHAYSTTPIAARWRTTCTTTVTTRWTGLRGPRSMRGEGGMP